jgi:predicted DNA-binding protein
MDIKPYLSKQEVQDVCKQLGLRDWTELTDTKVTLAEAKRIQEVVGDEALQISPEAFKQGLEVELEHGLMYPDANVTNNHPILTGMIVLAHLKEMLDYYLRLEVAELEGDMLKAYRAGDAQKLSKEYQKLIGARAALADNEVTD